MAAQRFAEGQGATVDDIEFRSDGKSEYCFVKVHQKGKHLAKLLGEVVEDVLAGIHFGKTMGWENTTTVFSRPIRWLLALHGSTVVPASVKLRDEGDTGAERVINSGRVTYGHRRLAAGPITIDSTGDYLDTLEKHYVLADHSDRKKMLVNRVHELAKSEKLVAEDDDDLYEEIADLVEYPDPIVGAIPEDALVLPEDIIITPMKVHQRYIPLRAADGSLSHKFICVANGQFSKEGRDIIRAGNERVLNARLRDARYFWDTDTQTPLKAFAEKLNTVMFHQKLGSVADKVTRLRDLYFTLKQFLPEVDDRKMGEVLTLMKADLTTQMVFEFDSLEGVVGMLYARKEGIDEDIARAIFEHRLPRRADDALPQCNLGTVAGILDRFDTLAGYFGIGQRVKGTSDPMGLRRNALALLSIIDANQLDIDLEVFVRAALANYGEIVHAPDKALQTILDFFSDRMAVMLRDHGYVYDQVAAALAVHGKRPVQLHRCLDAISKLEEHQLQDLAEQTKRMQRIVKDPADAVDESLLDDNEKALNLIRTDSADKVRTFIERKEFDKACEEILTWVPIIAAYFEAVLVNDQNDRVRQNRHALVRDVRDAITLTADFTQIEKKA